MKEWLALGYSHDSFWKQTFKTFTLSCEAARDRLIREHNDRAWLAWHVAALGRVKKPPTLSKLQINKTSRTQSVPLQQRLLDLEKWVVATGGKVIQKP